MLQMTRRPRRAFIFALCLGLLVLALGVMTATATVTPVQITGEVGVETADVPASAGTWYLRYVGNPAPAGYSHAYQWAQPQIICTPDTTPANIEGTLDVTNMSVGDVTFVGLIDKGLMGVPSSGYQSGAYLYAFRTNATTIRVGPSDGNLGGEIVQTFQDVTIPGDNILDVTIAIDGAADPNTCASGPVGSGVGCVTVTVEGGTPIADSYGNIKSLNNSILYGHTEFAQGAYPGWDDYGTSNVVYDLEVTGCDVDDTAPVTNNVVAVPNPVGTGQAVTLTADVDDSGSNGIVGAAEYSVDAGPWTPMAAADSAFDEMTEGVTAGFNASATPGNYNLCVRGIDASGNVGTATCTILEVKLLCTTVCYADVVGGNDANGGASPADAKKTIQAAVNAVNAGGQVIVAPGIYPENVTVNKSVTISGANAGVSPNDPVTPLNPNGARGSESEVTVTGGNSAFKIAAADVTIDGFMFTNTAVGTTGNIQFPIIGAGGNYGGDAPGVKVINNRFVDTSRVLVFFNGPTQMAGGTIEHNRVENPTRADGGICGTPPATASGACGYQLFNPWRTDNVSFQHNVAYAPAGNRDRVRTINVSWSTDVTLSYNTLRYTCIYTCFSIPLDASPVEVSYNDAVTDAGQVLALHPTWTTGMVNAHHNQMTTGGDFPISIDNPTADLDNVHVNRNAIFGTYHVRNGTDNLVTPGLETLDATCNWWGAASGPNPANFFGPSDFTPWLTSSDLDGLCADGIFVSTRRAGMTDDGLDFGSEDVIMWDGAAWSMFFDGSAAGLAPSGKWKHDINAIYIPDPSTPANMIVSFTQNRRRLPDIPLPVDGMDLVKWDGATWSMWFDGSDVALTGKTQEKIDSLHVLPGSESPIGAGCVAYLLVSTQGPGKVPNYSGGTLKFQGEDVLGFCATNLGDNTTGLWHMVLDGSAQGMPRNATDSIGMSADGNTMYLTTRGNFNVDAAAGGHSMVYTYDMTTETFAGPVFDAAANGLHEFVDALQVNELP